MSLIELERVRYRYEDGKRALDDINLKVEAGESVLLAGASGSGKSTLCRALNGLIPHFHGGVLEGRVLVDGRDTRTHPVHRLFSIVGLVFQNPDAQLFNSTVEREVAFGLASLGLPREEIHARLQWALEAARIAHLKDRAPHSLSGGEQQIVAIAAILALRPRVLVLDEPFANLDPDAMERVCALLRDIHAQGTAIILAEHRLHAALGDATRLVVLDHGRVVRDGEPRMVLREDLAQFNLNIPFFVRFAREQGWHDIPLSVDQALVMARAHPNAQWVSRPNGSRPAAPVASPVVEARGVSFAREGGAVLRDIDLDVSRGECVAVVGRNGSGKTTLLKHLNGLYRPSRGTLRVFGLDTRHARVSQLAAQVGFVFQNPNDQLFKPNVREEIEVAPRALHRLDAGWIEKLVNWFGLRPLLDRSPFTLSEGEKKRVAFAAALAAHPELVVLDEPTTGQDFAFRMALTRLLRDLQGEGIAIIFATHDLGFAEDIAPRWIVLADGEIAADAAPDDVMRDESVMRRAALRPTARFRLQHELSRSDRVKVSERQ
ncbi:MAG TPA: ATP-binding cassette domain-containing protein [Anaerolineae bacterium]